MSPPNTNSKNIDITGLTIQAGTSDYAAIVMMFNGKHIAVSIFSGQTLEDRLISLLGESTALDDDESEVVTNEVLYDIIEAGELHFLQVAPPVRSSSDETVHSLLYPEAFHFRFQTVHGTPTIIPIRASEACIVLDNPAGNLDDIDFSVNSNLPQYPSTQVRIQEAFVRAFGVVSRVLVNDEVLFCKAAKTGLFDPDVQRELNSLQRVEEARATSSFASIRIPRLRGYVTHAESGHIIGLLREWIPSNLMDGYACVRDLDVGSISGERRHKWAAQICETVHQLHEIGLVWGDGKIENVVIDKDDNAWLIDFGGGWTRDWVDSGLADTVEGDEQALRNIFKFLHMDE